MTTTTLPVDLELRIVRDMNYRETAYVSPEAMIVSKDRKLWICYDAWVSIVEDEVHDMRIERTKHAVIVYKETIVDCKYTISHDYIPNSTDIPVILK